MKKFFAALLFLGLFHLSTKSQHLLFENLSSINKRVTNFSSYTDSRGTEIKIGDTLIILKPEKDGNYNFVYFGNDLGGYKYLQSHVRDMKVFVDGIRVTKFQSERYVNMRCTAEGLVGAKYVINWEKAIDSGESKKEKTMTKEEALKILEEKKKLLDLGLITEEKYNEILNQLKPYIMK